jgi:hypothetical protein
LEENVDYEKYAHVVPHDDDSDFLQSYSKTPRKKLQTKCKFLDVVQTADSIPQQIQTWLAETAALDMAKAGLIEEMRPGKNELGGFRREHVNEYYLLLFSVEQSLPIKMIFCCIIASN